MTPNYKAILRFHINSTNTRPDRLQLHNKFVVEVTPKYLAYLTQLTGLDGVGTSFYDVTLFEPSIELTEYNILGSIGPYWIKLKEKS